MQTRLWRTPPAVVRASGRIVTGSAPGRVARPSVSPMNLGLGSAQAATRHGALCCSHVQIRVRPQAEAWCMVTAGGSLMFTASGSPGP